MAYRITQKDRVSDTDLQVAISNPAGVVLVLNFINIYSAFIFYSQILYNV